MTSERDAKRWRLTDYERAVCYYTLPRTTDSVTPALIVAYAVCLLEALGALVYGLVAHNRTVTVVGTVALGGIVVFGLFAFTVRALMNEIRRRRSLVVAKQVPEEDETAAAELPDPFEDHVLLRRPFVPENNLLPITGRDGQVKYTVEFAEGGARRRVVPSDGRDALTVRVDAITGSFMLEGMVPRRVTVLRGDTPVGRIRKRFTWGTPVVDLDDASGDAERRVFREGGLYVGSRLAGRIYALRDHLYLDIEREAFTESVLGLFAALSHDKALAVLF